MNVVRQVLQWDGTDVWIDQPGDDSWDTAAQRHEFNLYVKTAVALQITRVQVQSPHVSMVISDGQLLLSGLVGILDLGDTYGPGEAVASKSVWQHVIHVKFRVVNGRDDGMVVQAVVDQKVPVIAREHMSPLDVRRIQFRMARVVLG